MILGFTPFAPKVQLLIEEASPGSDLRVFEKHRIPKPPELHASERRFPSCVCYLVGSCTLEALLSLLVFLPSARRISVGKRSNMRALSKLTLPQPALPTGADANWDLPLFHRLRNQR